jgi:hypothetical protein
MSDPPDYSALGVSDTLPDRNGPDYGDALPPGLVGATIVRFGAARGGRLDGGGLVIDYIPKGSALIHRVVFGLNEAGMWIEHISSVPAQD